MGIYLDALKHSAAIWFPIVTLIVGWVLKSISDAYEHRRTLEREREGRAVGRRDQLAERRNNFQRQTLLELQEAISDIARTTASMHLGDLKSVKQTGEWQKHLYPEDLDEKSMLAFRKTSILNSRIRDEVLRKAVNQFKGHAANVTDSGSQGISVFEFQKMAEVFEQVNERIGQLLRQLDDEV
jgi:hypothetical protein